MTHSGEDAPKLDLESLFVLSGGFNRRLERLRLARNGRIRGGPVAAVVAGITWLPLLVLSAVEGLAWGDQVQIPFLKDFLPYGQFFVAAPLLILADTFVGRRLGRAGEELRRSDILAAADTPTLEELLARTAERWRGRRANLAILAVTLAATIVPFWGATELVPGGWQYVDDRVTMAGWWHMLVSSSLLRFLILRWIWRLLSWAWVLWRTARMRLQPRPAHPDRAGGLGFLGATQASFGVLAFALGVQLSCLLADAVHYHGVDLMAYRGHVTAFVFIAVTVLCLPLLPFAPTLARARGDGLVFLSGCGYEGAVRLEEELRQDASEVFSSPDISGLADFGMLYENARDMRPFPIDLRQVVTMALSALVPFLPLLFLVMPAQEVLESLRGLIF